MQKSKPARLWLPRCTRKPTAEVVDAWISLLRTERTLIDKVEERLKRAGLPPLDWYHVLNEVDRAPKSRLRQAQVRSAPSSPSTPCAAWSTGSSVTG